MGGDFCTPYTFYLYSVNDYPYSVNDYKYCGDTKNAKNTHFQSAFGHKKTETPIFQGVSAVLPKVYLGGGRDRSRIIDSQCE